MELRHLQALEAVVATGSFTAAAAARHMSQPALWMQIKDLEGELGFRLFERSGRGVVPTSACRALAPSLRTTLLDVEELRRVSREIRDGWAAPARIGCGPSFVARFLAGCIRELQERDARTPFPVVVPITSKSAIETLTSGEVDLLVEPSQRPSRLDHIRLYDFELVVLGPLTEQRKPSRASNAHKAQGTSKTIDIRLLHQRALATLPGDSLVRRRLEDAARRARISLRIVYESRDAAALRALAAQGTCDVVVHDELLPEDEAARAPRLVVGAKTLRDGLWLVWRSDDSLSPAARALRDVMRERARRQAR